MMYGLAIGCEGRAKVAVSASRGWRDDGAQLPQGREPICSADKKSPGPGLAWARRVVSARTGTLKRPPDRPSVAGAEMMGF
jgi:hypothetical protein